MLDIFTNLTITIPKHRWFEGKGKTNFLMILWVEMSVKKVWKTDQLIFELFMQMNFCHQSEKSFIWLENSFIV